jgi:outer membrane protein assembly factor BamB
MVRLLLALALFMLAACSGGGAERGPIPPSNSPSPSQALWDSWRGPHHTGVADTVISSSNIATLTRRWSVALNDPVFGTPVVMGNMVIVGGKRSTYGIDRATGSIIWRFSSPQNYLLFSSPTLRGDLAIVSTAWGGAATYALDSQTGTPRWSRDFGTNFSAYDGALVDGNELLVGLANQQEPPCSHGSLLALDSSSGTTMWSHDTAPNEFGAGIWSASNLTQSGNVVVTTGNPCGPGTGVEGDSILAFSQSGTELWSFQAPEAASADAQHADYDFGSTPVDANGTLVAVSKDGIAHGIDSNTGASRWEYRVAAGSCCPSSGGSISSPAWDGTYLYLGGGSLAGDGTGRFVALSNAGREIWSAVSPLPVTTPPTVAQDVVLVGLGSTLTALKTRDGSKVWNASLPAAIWAGAAVAGNDLVAASSDGSITLYELPATAAAASVAKRQYMLAYSR